MADQKNENASKATWFVGASLGGTEDQLPRFLSNGIWENGNIRSQLLRLCEPTYS